MTKRREQGSSPLDTSISNLLRIAIPISLGSLVQFLVVLTDNFFLSRAGELEINGAGNAGLVYLTFSMAVIGGSVGIQILVARFKGEGHIPHQWTSPEGEGDPFQGEANGARGVGALRSGPITI